ncbi:TonB-dependent siderophore receptor [Horticoccus luteus]|uniref:TonB-dependent siderophore receptor n=1 Tax=Horticoccus luteus TaxID=2862869 RepID=A0A8F9TRF2_9BACT|nr:TonB-dependent siderophore receptor [Horticoccus luteus]QYM77819.1 TonB-dependent siderophore receptor [Horticoccus luteus]
MSQLSSRPRTAISELVPALTALAVMQGFTAAAHAADDDNLTAATHDAPVALPKLTVQDSKVKSIASPKYTQPLRDTPQTVVVIPRAVYTEQGATSLRDVLRNTPGITFQAGEGGNAPGDNLFIRGFGARNDVFLDGVRDAGVMTRDTFNVEQVEVVKGPSSATFGRGSTGGSVNQVTKTPGLRDATKIEATAGNADYARATLDANQALPASPIPGTAIRLNAVWTDAGVAGRDEVKNRNWGLAPSLAFGLGTPTTVTLAYQHLSQDNIPDYGLPGTLPAVAFAAGQTIADLDWSNFYGLVARDYEKIESDGATAIVTHKFPGGAALRNLTRYGRNTRDAVVTPPRAATAANAAADPGFDPTLAQIRRTDTKYQDRRDEILANQTNFNASFTSGSVQHDFGGGIEVSREDQRSDAKTDLFSHGRPPVTDLYHPNPHDAYTPAIVRTGAFTKAIADTGAVYAFDTAKFGPQWELNAGARWETFDVSYRNVAANGTSTRFQRTDHMLSWRGGLVFKPAPEGSLYAGYGTSFNPSADSNQGLALAATGNSSASLAPEKNLSSEIGAKWDFLKTRLSTTLAFFRTEKTNARTTDAAGDTVLAGDQQVEGIEIGVNGRLTDTLSIFSGYAYMEGTVKSSGVAQQVDAALQYVPRQTLNLWATQRLPAGFTVGAGAQFTDGYFYALPSATSAPSAGLGTRYWLYGAMASYEVNKHLTLRLNVNNLADKRYIDRGYGGHVIPGAGRTVLFNATYSF